MSGSPYIVDSTIVVEMDKELCIDPGVTVQFPYPDSLKVYGKLVAQGTPDSLIQFVDSLKTIWGGIWFLEWSHNCYLEWVTISRPHIGLGIEYGQYLSQPVILDCQIMATSIGVWGLDSYFILQNSLIETEDEGITSCISLQGATPRIEYCQILANTGPLATYATGIKIANCDPIINYCTIHVNGSSRSYGIWAIGSSKAEIEYNLIRAFSQYYAYGGFLVTSDLDFINNTVVVQSATSHGEGIYLQADSDPLIKNCLLYGDGYSRGIVALDSLSSRPVISYNDIYNQAQNTVGCSPGIGCLFLDPLFVSPTNGNYNLTFRSPCINAGDSASTYDPDGTIADIGCYYYDLSASLEPMPAPFIPDSYGIITAFPNPFNATCHLEVSLPYNQCGDLAIYNQQGQVIEHLKTGRFSAGLSAFTWTVGDRGSGVYWAVLQTSSAKFVKQLNFIK